MKITAKQLQVFANIAKLGNVSKAAQEIGLTQSAASMALSELESQLGAHLFDRHGKKLILNEIGKQILPKAIEIIDKMSAIESMAKSPGLNGSLKIGASTTIGNYLLPGIISGFAGTHPEIEIDLQVGNTQQVIDKIEQFELDIGFIEGNCESKALNIIPWHEDELIIVACQQHPLANTPELKLEDLSSAQWIMREQGSGTREIFELAIHKSIPKLNILLELGSTEAIKKGLMNSQALACVSRLSVQQELKNNILTELKLQDFSLTRKLYQISHRDKSISNITEAFSVFMKTPVKAEKPRYVLKPDVF